MHIPGLEMIKNGKYKMAFVAVAQEVNSSCKWVTLCEYEPIIKPKCFLQSAFLML